MQERASKNRYRTACSNVLCTSDHDQRVATSNYVILNPVTIVQHSISPNDRPLSFQDGFIMVLLLKNQGLPNKPMPATWYLNILGGDPVVAATSMLRLTELSFFLCLLNFTFTGGHLNRNA